MNKHDRLCEIAKSYIGVKEEGNNAGSQIELFQSVVSKPQKQAYCVDFALYCVDKVDNEAEQLVMMSLPDHNKLPRTEHALTMYNKSTDLHVDVPFAGCLIIWGFVKDGKLTGLGHCGIIVEVKDKVYVTVEGNTGPSNSAIEREGEGVYLKERKKTDYTTMKVMGYIDPWKK